MSSLLLVAACSCPPLPEPGSPTGDAAIGRITVSTPLFTPLDTRIEGRDRLDFGPLRNEQQLAERVQTSTMGIDQVAFDAVRAALALRAQGPTIEDTSTARTRGEDPTERHDFESERRRTFRSPDVPDLAARPSLPAAVDQALVRLLERSGRSHALAPDDVATLVAAHKTYMLNLEKYYNIDGFGYASGVTSEFLPYAAHVTVTLEPGWFVRRNPYDAEVEIRFGDAGHAGAPSEIRVITVMPLEVAQTLERLTAGMRRLEQSLSLAGAFSAIAARAEIDRIKAEALRLEGMQRSPTMVVAYPEANAVAVRFFREKVPEQQLDDLVPKSRVLTVMMLVRNERRAGADMQYLATTKSAPFWRRTVVETAQLRRMDARLDSLRRFDKALYEAATALKKYRGATELASPALKELTPERRLEAEHVARLMSDQEARDDEGQRPQMNAGVHFFAERPLGVSVKGRFLPTLKARLEGARQPCCKLVPLIADSRAPITSEATIPPFFGELRTPLRIEQAFGYFDPTTKSGSVAFRVTAPAMSIDKQNSTSESLRATMVAARVLVPSSGDDPPFTVIGAGNLSSTLQLCDLQVTAERPLRAFLEVALVDSDLAAKLPVDRLHRRGAPPQPGDPRAGEVLLAALQTAVHEVVLEPMTQPAPSPSADKGIAPLSVTIEPEQLQLDVRGRPSTGKGDK